MDKDQQILFSPIPLDKLTDLLQTIVRQEIRNKDAEDLQEKLLSPDETRRLFNPIVSLVTLNSWTKKGLLTKYHLGGRTWYRYSEILQNLKSIKPYQKRN